jgi:hypothetical protein
MIILEGTTLETFEKSCRRLGFRHLLNLYEKAEDFAVLRVNAFTVTCHVTAEHFPISIRDFHGFSFLKRVRLLRTRPLERRTYFFSAQGGGRIGD